MEYTDKHDFTRRSQEIIDQYERLILPDFKKYEVTLLLNLCVGLLFVAHQGHSSKLPKTKLKTPQWGINPSNVLCCKRYKQETKSIVDERITIQNVTKHIRNSIAHYRFKIQNGSDQTISSIRFQDEFEGLQTFDLTLSVKDFKTFALEVSKKVSLI